MPFQSHTHIEESTPEHKIWLIEADSQYHVFVPNGSRFYRVDEESYLAFRSAQANQDTEAVEVLLQTNGLSAPDYIKPEPPTAFPPRALSLAVAQKCNLGCQYCYAEGGDFGAPARSMTLETALASVDRLIDGADPGDRVNIAFMGGEPLINRPVVQAATRHAAGRALERDVKVGFSITTNGTLVRPGDAEFFEEHGFAVTVSLDGIGAVHDRQRPYKSGRGSYDRILKNIQPLLHRQSRMQVSARVTVTAQNLDLVETLDGLLALGFHSTGFSPMLRSPNGRGEMGPEELQVMLERMIACGEKCEAETLAGRRYAFSNLLTAVQEIHKGTHRPYPCGAGAGYFGVSADGDLFACHRFVDDPSGRMGDIVTGVDPQRQEQWLRDRHVHFQEPCNSCWARYLCGGGCHHEVIERGRPACDYIRGWLHYCLQAYVRLSNARPDLFEREAHG